MMGKFLGIFFLICIMFIPASAITPAQVKTFIENNGWLGEHIEYAQVGQWHYSDLWINTSTLPEDYTVNFKDYLKVHDVARQIVLDALDMGVKVKVQVYDPSMNLLVDWTSVPIEATIRQDRVYRLRFSWQRTDSEYYDWVLFDILKWAEWSPTTYTITIPTATSVLAGNADFFGEINDSFINRVFYYFNNATGNFSQGYMQSNRQRVSCVNVSIDYGYSTGHVIWDSVYYGGEFCDTCAYNANDGYWGLGTGLDPMINGRFWFCVANEDCIGSINVTTIQNDNYEFWIHGRSDAVKWSIFTIEGTEYNYSWTTCNTNPTTTENGWCNLANITISDGVLNMTINHPGVSDYIWFDSFELRRDDQLFQNYTYFQFDTTGLADGAYNFCLNATNHTWAQNITCNSITILQSPDPPTCNSAIISNDHWLYNYSKLINPDPALSLSGCILEAQWDNGTIYNNSWGAGVSNWYNLTLQIIPNFYGTHYLISYCNDSVNAWVKCSQDSYDISAGSGLTSEQNATLYALLTTGGAVTQDVDVITGIFLFAGLCFAAGIIIWIAGGRNEILSFFGKLLFMFFIGLGIFVMSLGASAIWTGWNNTAVWNQTGTGIPDTIVTMSIWAVWLFVLLVVVGLIFWYMFWLKKVKI